MTTKLRNQRNNVAYIDGANLQNAVERLDWYFDYTRFRIWLKDKFGVNKAYLFVGYIPRFEDKYKEMRSAGYELIFKETTRDRFGKIKGNIDADLVLKAVRDVYEDEFEETILVSSDGDYACLINFWKEKNRRPQIISPYQEKFCSRLLKKTAVPIFDLSKQRSVLEKGRNHKNEGPR